MPHGADEGSLRHQLVFLRRWWLVPVLLSVLGGAPAAALTALEGPVYEARASVELRLAAGGQPGTGATLDDLALVATELDRRCAGAADDAKEDGQSPPQVAIDDRAGTYVLDIRARSTTSDDAAQVATTFADCYAQGPAAAGDDPGQSPDASTFGAIRLDPEATPPTQRVSASPMRNGALGVSGGLLVGLVLASLLDRVDDRLRRREDLEVTVDLPVVGVLPREPLRDLQDGPRALLAAGSPSAEAYDALLANIESLASERPMRCLQVAGATVGAGTTTVATALALSLARAGYRVILLDGDLSRPTVHTAFGLPNETGLAQVLSGQRSLAEAVAAVDGEPTLAVLPAGPVPANPSELLASDRFRAVVATLRANCDVLLFDGQPVLAGPDALIVARQANAILLVGRPGHSTRRQVRRAHHLLGQAGAPVVGTVLNGAPPSAGRQRGGRAPERNRATDEKRRPLPLPPPTAAGQAAPAGETRAEVSS